MSKSNKDNKIILIGPLPPPLTGQSVSFKMLVSDLEDRGFKINLVDISRQSIKSIGSKGLVRCYEVLNAYLKLLVAFILGSKICYITISQSSYGLFRDLLFVCTAKMFRVKVIAHLKGGNYDGFYFSKSFLVKFIIRGFLKMLDKLIVLGNGLVSMYDFIPDISNKIVVVNNGLPIKTHGFNKKIKNGDKIQIVFLSNLIESKGYIDILHAVKILKYELGINIKAVFAGEFVKSPDDTVNISKNKDNFFQFIERNSLSENIEYVGTINGSKKWKLLQDSHFFCLPTNYINEGQPVSIIEAMAFGCVILSTKYRAIPDLVEDNYNGNFVAFKNPQSIVDKIVSIISEEKFDIMSKNSLNTYQSSFTHQIHLNNLINQITN